MSELGAAGPQPGPGPQDPIRDDFFRTVDKACKLLDFLIGEGHPCHIPDKIIDDIEAAREYRRLSHSPTFEQRADLLKAYRDLVDIPRTSVTFEGRMPPTPFWSMCSPWLLSLIAILIIGVVAITIFGWIYWGFKNFWTQYWYIPVAYPFLASWLVWGFYVFTGVVTDRKLNQIIAFCYTFTIIALAASTLPWWLPALFSGEPSEAPAGVLQGCALGTSADIPKGVQCGNDNTDYQWVLNIGGVVSEKRATAITGAEATKTLPPTGGEITKVGQKPATSITGGEATKTPPVTGGESGKPTPVAGEGTAKAPGGEAAKTGQKPATATFPEGIYGIRGGLVVPLYVIVLALFGGAVSMTRRVPEYQRRAMDSQDPLLNEDAREDLVFQIMQVITAPLIAISAYYIVKPDTVTTSVLLGFASGFASEPILLMIRNLVDKLTPAEPTKPTLISVRVNPPSAKLKPKEAKQFKAEVLGSPTNSEVTWAIDPPGTDSGTISESGNYVAPDKEGTVTITARSVADKTKFGSASVTIAVAKPSVNVTPPAVTLQPGRTQLFSHQVSGSANSDVIWSLDPAGDASGRISPDGNYVAPQSTTERTVTVIARSKSDPAVFGSAKVTVRP